MHWRTDFKLETATRNYKRLLLFPFFLPFSPLPFDWEIVQMYKQKNLSYPMPAEILPKYLKGNGVVMNYSSTYLVYN